MTQAALCFAVELLQLLFFSPQTAGAKVRRKSLEGRVSKCWQSDCQQLEIRLLTAEIKLIITNWNELIFLF